MASTGQLLNTSEALNERQRSYLLTVYAEDQLREIANKGRPGAPPASRWRWIEFGPVGGEFTDNPAVYLLRRPLEHAGLIDQKTVATWNTLAGHGLMLFRHAHTGFTDVGSGRPVLSLMVRMTTDGRKVARLIKDR